MTADLSAIIAAITDPLELDGFRDQLARDGRMTTDIQHQIATRKAELAVKAKGK